MDAQLTFQENVDAYSKTKSRLSELDDYFSNAIIEAVILAKKARRDFNGLYPSQKYQSCNIFPPYSDDDGFGSIVYVGDEKIEFNGYVCGHCGDSDGCPKRSIQTELVRKYYTNHDEFKQYFAGLLTLAIKTHEEKLQKAKLEAEAAERAKFEELKKKFERN